MSRRIRRWGVRRRLVGSVTDGGGGGDAAELGAGPGDEDRAVIVGAMCGLFGFWGG